MPPRGIPVVVEIRGRTLILWEDVDNKFIRACLAEFLAMHLFVLLCCGCAMVTLNLPNPNLMMVAASFGFGILTLAQIFGPLSGGHINSAVSLGLFVAGRTSLVKTVCYTLSQMLGSVFGALFLWAIFGDNWPAARAFGSNSYDESVFTGGQVFFAEMLGTMLLVFNVLSTIDIPQEGGGPLGVYPIAMSVMVAHLFLIPIDGCSINPTRSFGPSLVAQWANIQGAYYHQQPVFWFGPMFGAVVAAFFYEYGTLKPENFAGAKDMDTAIFQANKKSKRKIKKKTVTSNPQPTDIEQDMDVSGSSSHQHHQQLQNVVSSGYEQSTPQRAYPRQAQNIEASPIGEMVTNPMLGKPRGISPPVENITTTASPPADTSSTASHNTAKVYHKEHKDTTGSVPTSMTQAQSSGVKSPPVAPKSAPPTTLPDIPTVPSKPGKGNKQQKQEQQGSKQQKKEELTRSAVAAANITFGDDFEEEDLM